MISQATIEKIREQANLIEVVSEIITLKRQGNGMVGLCPFHGEKTPSFHVRADGSYYHCFGCGASGNVFSFLMQHRGLSFPEAVEELAVRYDIPIEKEGKVKAASKDNVQRPLLYKLNSLAQKFFRMQLKQAEKPVLDYLQQRGIGKEALESFAIGFAPRSWNSLVKFFQTQGIDQENMLRSGLVRRSPSGDLYDVFRGRLIFPIWVDNKRIAAFGGRLIPNIAQAEELKNSPKYLNSAESPIYQKSKIFFGVPQAEGLRQNAEVYLVEGYMDVVGLWQAGVRNVLATCGTAVTENHAKRLARLVKRVVVLFDGDNAGRTAAARCFPIFINTGLDASALFLDEGQDPDDLARKESGATQQYLQQHKRLSLLECYIMWLLGQYGCSRLDQLGAANKGRFCQEILTQLAKVKNSIERDELFSVVSRLLLIEKGSLLELASTERVPTATPKSETSKPAAEQEQAVPINNLALIDREILTAVMVLKEKLSARILNDHELCAGLDSSCLLFVTALDRALKSADDDTEQKREVIKQILQKQGLGWLEHWKEAYRRAQDPEYNFEALFDDCRRGILKRQLNQQLTSIQEELSMNTDQEQKELLASRVAELGRARQAI